MFFPFFVGNRLSPFHFLSERCDVRNMMTAVPGIQLQQPVEVSRTMFGMAKRPRKIGRLQGPEKHHPPLMERLE
jgi:hypothetical protein